jgi:hypothetical protein
LNAANEELGSRIFISGITAESFAVNVFARVGERDNIAGLHPRAGSFQVHGLGTSWVANSGKGGRGQLVQPFENVVEVEGALQTGCGRILYSEAQADGSGRIGMDLSAAYSDGAAQAVQTERHVGVDYSGRSGAPALIAIVDRLKGPGKKTWTLAASSVLARPPVVEAGPRGCFSIRAEQTVRQKQTPSLRATAAWPKDRDFVVEADAALPVKEQRPYLVKMSIEGADAVFFVVMTIQEAKAPVCEATGEGLGAVVKIGKQQVRFDGRRIVLAPAE